MRIDATMSERKSKPNQGLFWQQQQQQQQQQE